MCVGLWFGAREHRIVSFVCNTAIGQKSGGRNSYETITNTTQNGFKTVFLFHLPFQPTKMEASSDVRSDGGPPSSAAIALEQPSLMSRYFILFFD
jgi:hypothetical protein